MPTTLPTFLVWILAATAAPDNASKQRGDEGEMIWGAEVAYGAGLERQDAYINRLLVFDFDSPGLLLPARRELKLRVTWQWRPRVEVMAMSLFAGGRRFERLGEDRTGVLRKQRFSWSTYGLGIYGRGKASFWHGVFVLYAQLGGGLAMVRSSYVDPIAEPRVEDHDTHWGIHLGCASGWRLMLWRHFGVFGEASYFYAPVMKNLLGDVHDSGGPALVGGIRAAW